MIQIKQNASLKVPVALVSSSDGRTPVTGKSGTDATVTFVKGDGTTANYAATATLTEITANAFSGAGVYQLTVPTAVSDVLGPLAWAVSVSGADVSRGFIDVVAQLASDVKSVADALGGDVTAIKAKTDNLPASPANETTAAAIKAKTDNLPSDPADQSDVETAIETAVDGLDFDVDLTPVLEELEIVRAAVCGHRKLHTTGPDANRLVIYEDETEATPLVKLACKDQGGIGTALATSIYEVVPVG